MVLARNLEHRRESSCVRIDSVAYPIGDLRAPDKSALLVHSNPGLQTCWLMRTMPISLRSSVNLSNAASMADVSVLLSTTRKFFSASAPAETCYRDY